VLTEGNAQAVADRFLAAWTSRDFATARTLLHDNVSFRGPIDAFSNADDYLGAIKNLAQIVKGIEKQKVVVDGQDVVEFYDLVTATPAGKAPVAEWYHVEGNKIDAIRVYFDARPFAAPH
jgi:hypothetical protein